MSTIVNDNPSNIDIVSRQKKLFYFRILITFFLIVSVTFLKHQQVEIIRNSAWFYIYLVLGINFIFCFTHLYIFAKHFSLNVQIWAQVITDLFTASILFILTGGLDSAFSFLFILAVVNTTFLGNLKVSLLTASIASILYGAILDAQYYGTLERISGQPAHNYQAAEVVTTIMITMGALFLVATLGGILSNQLEQSKIQLAHSQKELEYLGRLNENIINSIDIGLITLDTKGFVRSINQAVTYITGITWPEAVGLPFEKPFPELKKIMDLSLGSSSLNFSQHRSFDFDFIRPQDQAFLHLNIAQLKLLDRQLDIWGRLLVIKDLTLVRHMETEVKKTERLAAVGELASGLAHEIRNPLASMIGSWQMLTEGTLIEEDSKRMMKVIGREMERLAKIVSDFLAYARPPMASPQRFFIAKMIKDLLEVFEYRQDKNRTVKIIQDIDPTAEAYFDQGQLSQILWNLLQNSVEATRNDVEIKIEVKVDPIYQGWIRFWVTDNGEGIKPEEINHVFDPFFTTKSKGTGLGLALVGRIIHQGGGRITVDSKPQQGTTFKIYLPQVMLVPYNSIPPDKNKENAEKQLPLIKD